MDWNLGSSVPVYPDYQPTQRRGFFALLLYRPLGRALNDPRVLRCAGFYSSDRVERDGMRIALVRSFFLPCLFERDNQYELSKVQYRHTQRVRWDF